MTIVERQKVLAAFERAFLLDPLGGGEAAMAVAAQALCLPVEVVADVVRERDAELSA